jgi:hypothetical protein
MLILSVNATILFHKNILLESAFEALIASVP